MTHPATESTQSGQAADAVRTLQNELAGEYSEMRSAEIQLTEAILSAHAVTVTGRAQLQDIQRQLIEAITNPAAALDTPAGERQFLMFLRSKVAEIQSVIDAGALTDEDHARLTRALGSGYLLPTGEPAAPVSQPSAGVAADQAAGMAPAVGSALGALPQAAQGAAAAPAQGAAGLAGAATPLAGLASGLLDQAGQPQDDATGRQPDRDDASDIEDNPESDADTESESDTDADDDDAADRPTEPRPHGDRDAPDNGRAQTRPARLL
ncbi:DUF4226 domain-containing protein [Mycolicibacterium sp. 120270]|uniref:DUF4226 domain-containing protein n=1 Tax=Mycolicibacterium sp. 120270 TaxID=3090600 RepID=UPI00299E35D3|nr:DUF4226 domain-containing protein [Mycolicibacterium sp. 120270]MDX1885219.1 DUF4226 domain-containing protein [Mycolicibacterium sp. 120270]